MRSGRPSGSSRPAVRLQSGQVYKPTTVQHRWYRDNRLHQSVELRVQAGPSVGYRIYSRETMNSESAGSWRVELRTENGVLLHEERFSVR